jgi:ATP-dependent DNA helicase RecQ
LEQAPVQILQKFWGYKTFRPLQEDIIHSVLQGNDTLALLPTGGGKSICFQVPALLNEGICIVVSPLIALIKDQVENLQRRNIKALAIFSGMSKEEVDTALDNCIHGPYKFLYLSPERLTSELVRERIEKMKVNLFAVDEAHCISQWGYDFRPPYLKIAEIRELHPKVPVLALTATATNEVRDDIMDKLKFVQRNLFVNSFRRSNLSYLVYHEEDKRSRMKEILSKVPGTAIVYVRNRKKTRELAIFLQEQGLSADFYHAGLTPSLRNEKQDAWKNNRIRIMVCTNAFGMGIDKPDVRVVIHMDLPENLESYYQEAGRAGRDEKNAFAVVLYNQTDLLDLRKRQETSFPELKELKKVYQAVANYLQVPVNGGMDVSYEFDVAKFIAAYNLNPGVTVSSLKILEMEGLISLSDAVLIPSRIHMRINPVELYKFQVAHSRFDPLLKLVLRTTEGVFDDFARINESELADRLKTSYKEVVEMFRFLHQSGILFYEPRKDTPQLSFIIPREDATYISMDTKSYQERKQRYIDKSESMIHYCQSQHLCRSYMLLTYFGERADDRCGTCDYCREMKKRNLNEVELENFRGILFQVLESGPLPVREVINQAESLSVEKAIDIISWLVDQNELMYDQEGMLKIKSGKS